MSKDNIIPFPSPFQKQLENELQKQGIDIKDVQIKVFHRKQDAVSFGILQLIHLQNQVFDETLHLLLEKLAEKDNVRNIVKKWEEGRHNIEDYLENLLELVEEDF